MDLQAEAQKRKERLAALRATRLGGNTAAAVTGTDQPESGDSSAHAEKKPTLRTVTVEDKASEVAREALEKENVRSKEVDLLELAPKKPNWDLKRDLENKLEKLQRRTQACIIELIRSRLKEQGDITAGAAEQRLDMDESDED